MKADPNTEKPGLSQVIERNIRTIFALREKVILDRSLQERVADAITAFSGSMTFVYVHVAWFSAWILVNSGHLGVRSFDPFPYGLLTLIVSLEAIFLATFVLLSQNRLSGETERRADLNLHIGLLAEHELTRVLQMLDAIQTKLDVQDDKGEMADLEMETRPEDVLAEIDRLRRCVMKEKE